MRMQELGLQELGTMKNIDKRWEWEVGLQEVKVERYPSP